MRTAVPVRGYPRQPKRNLLQRDLLLSSSMVLNISDLATQYFKPRSSDCGSIGTFLTPPVFQPAPVGNPSYFFQSCHTINMQSTVIVLDLRWETRIQASHTKCSTTLHTHDCCLGTYIWNTVFVQVAAKAAGAPIDAMQSFCSVNWVAILWCIIVLHCSRRWHFWFKTKVVRLVSSDFRKWFWLGLWHLQKSIPRQLQYISHSKIHFINRST